MAPGDPVHPLRVTAVFKQAWENLFSAFWMLLALTLLLFLVQAPASALGPFLPQDPAAVLALQGVQFAYAVLVAAPFAVGLAWAHLKVSRGGEPQVDDLVEGWRMWTMVVVAYVLVMLAVLAGLLLLILPGIWVGVRLALTPYVLLDRREGGVEAMRGSWELTRGRFWQLLGLVLLSVLVVIAGILALVVGVFVAIPWTQQALATYYRSLAEEVPVGVEARGTPSSAPTA